MQRESTHVTDDIREYLVVSNRSGLDHSTKFDSFEQALDFAAQEKLETRGRVAVYETIQSQARYIRQVSEADARQWLLSERGASVPA